MKKIEVQNFAQVFITNACTQRATHSPPRLGVHAAQAPLDDSRQISLHQRLRPIRLQYLQVAISPRSPCSIMCAHNINRACSPSAPARTQSSGFPAHTIRYNSSLSDPAGLNGVAIAAAPPTTLIAFSCFSCWNVWCLCVSSFQG